MPRPSRSPAPPQRARTPNPPPSRRSLVQSSPDKPPYPSGYDYTSDGVRDHNILNLKSSSWQVLGVVTVVALFVRLFRIYQPAAVVFDEVHFGGFASKYIKGKFFMDVHPPLAKLLITLAGWLAGFNGEFDFKEIGLNYLEPAQPVPYVAMRMFPAICGVLTVPIVFLTLKASGCRTATAAMGAGLVIFENGLVTQSRLILLDSPLIVCTALTALSWTSFTNQHELGPINAFKPSWWFWLVASGVSLGATASVKWVGLFTIAWVGSLTLLQLWVLLGDTRTVTTRVWFKHVFARVFCLIVIPVAFYMAMFAIHFMCLVNPGDGDGFMSSEFQATLNNKGMTDVPADVAYGSRVSLRHWNTQGGYLHSHLHMYPTGSGQQQITLYPHKDENNVWLLEHHEQPRNITLDPTGNTTIPGPYAWDNIPLGYLEDGAFVRLYHMTTHRRLHSHDEKPPVTEAEWQQEVTAYGYEGFEGDANDMFRIEIVKSMSDGRLARRRLRTIQTKFKLVHVMSGCVLFSHKVKLPDWGFEQQEVTCAKQGSLPNSIWYIEQNLHPNMDESAEKVNYRLPSFFGKFWELNRVMWETNNALVEAHAWDSRPPSWPIMRRGISFWGANHRTIYLQGNPLIWWSSTAAIALYVAFKGLALLRWQRDCNDYSNAVFKRFDYEIGQSVLGWALHYFPFYLMQRQLFLHHYFPALIFAILALCQIYDFVTARFKGFGISERPVINLTGVVVFLAASIAVFSLYAPLSYGNMWTKKDCARTKLLSTWDWDCNTFHDNYTEYAFDVTTAANAAIQTSAPAAAAGPPPPIYEDPSAEVHVTAAVPEIKFDAAPQQPEQKIVPLGSNEKVEFRDEDGNILDPEMVKSLEGKVSFSTRYETRTRLVDTDGNEIKSGVDIFPDGPDGSSSSFAGTRADGQEQNTFGEAPASQVPPTEVNVDADVSKEKAIPDAKATLEPEPESPAVGKETAKDEL